MGDVDPKTLADSSRRYARLCWMYWRFFLGGMVIFGVNAVPLFVFEPQRPTLLFDTLIFLLSIAFIMCQVVALGAWHSLMQFRCPRCGERFILSWWSSWPGEACKHCGLKLEKDFAKPKARDHRHFNDDSGWN